ncbi:CDP-alcohol phosphatidyltransferase family protein [Terrimonas sp. NA20]|uniref:CDP-alcohol phosphatidyltransferase family protein n=1 Tax=Terrimonas ginsenosidimutans TaxID=2908004 RepID=A0ABS9KPW3_9BACT|nr:CDP-alcohol phosphatidyltransferase family protein [Terrimonas ginsenosidimutans]MCG2614351.1 CDP-alcohol phosphatidyltransferase family protein [Terrimonas ginsenosidimutans]
MKQIPNIFTLLNLVFGCIAIVFILQNGLVAVEGANGTQLLDIPEKVWIATLFIALAGAVDFLDGFMARLFKVDSAMGKQLDSLADVVSFGVAPGMILYQMLRLSFAQGENGLDTPFIWPALAFILPAAAAYRLAKFNLDSSQSQNFKGVPTPAVGLVIASLPVLYWQTDMQWVRDLLLSKVFIITHIIGLSILMVCSLPIMSFKFKDFSIQNNIHRYILLLIAVLSIIFLGWLAAPVIFISYVLVSLLFIKKLS